MCKSCPVVDWAEGLPDVTAFGRRKVTETMGEHVVWYHRYDSAHKPLVGGKNASLGEMMTAGLPVPPGFAVTVDAYQRIWDDHELLVGVNELLARIDHSAHAATIKLSLEIRDLIESVPVPDDIAADIVEAYEALSGHCGVHDVPVAVRSSATAEDLPDASFAGQQDTFLWIRGGDAVVDHVRRCWSSLYTDRAIAYRHTMGYLHVPIAMSVGVQKMVDPRTSGVAFTLNPTTGDRTQVAIDASWGLGEAVVSGEVTPDNYLVDKVLREVVSRRISPKTIEYRLNDDGAVEKLDVEADRQCVPCMSDDDLRAVMALARRAEQHYGCPQDVEWAIDRHLPDGENVLMLQSRPETVWSQRECVSVSQGRPTGVASIVSTLMTPMYQSQSKG